MIKNKIKPITIGHIIYAPDKKIKQIFQKSVTRTEYIATFEGIISESQNMSPEFRDILENNGVKIINIPREYIANISSYCDIKINVTNIKEKSVVKHIMIRIPATNYKELVIKTEKIISAVRNECGISPLEEHTYNKITRC